MKNYLSCTQAAKMLNPRVTPRRMRVLAPQIPGAVQYNSRGPWFIPPDFKDPRKWSHKRLVDFRKVGDKRRKK